LISLENAADKLRRTGFKLTPQRMAVIRYLSGNKNHPSAQTVFNDLRETWEGLSLATVYNTLETLKSIGELQELCLSKDRSYYDPDESPHAHFICRKCGSVTDIPSVSRESLPEFQAEGFSAESVTLYYTGLCPGCRH
jgi:Fur family peroxide stress response transcriptional regulator